MKIAINTGFSLGKKRINKFLASKTMPIPSHLGKYFELSDLTVGYYDDYLALGLTPTFTKPTELNALFPEDQVEQVFF